MNANLCQVTYSQSRYEPMTTVVLHKDFGEWGLCCTNPVRDSSRESSMVAVRHEQTDTSDLQDQELAGLQ